MTTTASTSSAAVPAELSKDERLQRNLAVVTDNADAFTGAFSVSATAYNVEVLGDTVGSLAAARKRFRLFGVDPTRIVVHGGQVQTTWKRVIDEHGSTVQLCEITDHDGSVVEVDRETLPAVTL